ncbi:hypothetical protein, partial [Escherichia coli]|uniref:hypothetical protein n=1 Tax=Escherichia coli TaxID=562 RepID=UPI003D805E4A
LKMPAFEWVHVQLHQQKGMISLSPPTICNSAEFFGGVVRGMTTRQRLPHLSEALWRDAETPGNSATPVPGPQ